MSHHKNNDAFHDLNKTKQNKQKPSLQTCSPVKVAVVAVRMVRVQLYFMLHWERMGKKKKKKTPSIRTRTRTPGDTHSTNEPTRVYTASHLPSQLSDTGRVFSEHRGCLVALLLGKGQKETLFEKKGGVDLYFFFFKFKLMRSSRIRKVPVWTACEPQVSFF